jgi:tRNA(Ile)-lysidine synthase
MSLNAVLYDFCCQYGWNNTYWVAYSGGIDSHVLLHLLAELRKQHPIELRAIHVNHGLSPHAAMWAAHCASVCQALNVGYIQKSVVVAAAGNSLEAEARHQRYAIFSSVLTANDILLTSHHQDDQAETLLLQLLRGAGPKGLAAMPVQKSLGTALHARPLLNFSRHDIEAYAEANQLRWIEDESNANTDFSRNFIRQDIMPLFKQRWPSAAVTLARAAQHCAEAQLLVETLAAQDLAHATGSVPDTLSIAYLLTLDAARQKQVLRWWLKQLGLSLPSTIKIERIREDVLLARADKMPHVNWVGGEVRRYDDDLYGMQPLAEMNKQQSYIWDFKQPLLVPDIGTLTARQVIGQGIRADIGSVSVRFRQGGEVCRLPGRQCSHQLKKLMQEWRIPPWQRDRIPLLYVEDKLVAGVGFFVCEEVEAKANNPGYSTVVTSLYPTDTTPVIARLRSV